MTNRAKAAGVMVQGHETARNWRHEEYDDLYRKVSMLLDRIGVELDDHTVKVNDKAQPEHADIGKLNLVIKLLTDARWELGQEE
jgi:hypothetical protein